MTNFQNKQYIFFFVKIVAFKLQGPSECINEFLEGYKHLLIFQFFFCEHNYQFLKYEDFETSWNHRKVTLSNKILAFLALQSKGYLSSEFYSFFISLFNL